MSKKFTGDIKEYNPDFLDCRENHNWKWVTDWNIVRGAGGRLLEFSRVKKCERCGTLVRKQYDGQTGRSLGKNSYTYVEGYQATKGNPIDAGLARLEQLRRQGITG